MSKEIEIFVSFKAAMSEAGPRAKSGSPRNSSIFVFACCDLVLDYASCSDAAGFDTGPRGRLLARRSISSSALREDDGDDEAIQGQSLGEDHHENERNKDISLCITANASVTDNTNAETSSEVRETAA